MPTHHTRLDKTLRDAVVPIEGVTAVGPTAATIQYAKNATPADKTNGDSILASFDWSDTAQMAWEQTVARPVAKDVMDNRDPLYVVIRATALVIMDQINALRAVQKPAIPPLSRSDMTAAIQAKIDSGAADGT